MKCLMLGFILQHQEKLIDSCKDGASRLLLALLKTFCRAEVNMSYEGLTVQKIWFDVAE